MNIRALFVCLGIAKGEVVMTIREAVIRKIKEMQYVAAPISDDTNLYTDLGFDSITFIGLLVQVEDMFSITFDIDEMQGCVRAGRLIELAEAKCGSRERK